MARSRGVTIYGTYALVVGTLLCAGNVGLVVLAARVSGGVRDGAWRPWVGAVIGGLMVAAGVGVFRLSRWGRGLAMLTSVSIVALAGVNLARMPWHELIRHLGFVARYVAFPAILNGGIVWFFTRPGIVAQFQES